MIHLNEVRRSSVDIQVQISELIAFSCCCMKQFLLRVMTCEAHDVSLGETQSEHSDYAAHGEHRTVSVFGASEASWFAKRYEGRRDVQ